MHTRLIRNKYFCIMMQGSLNLGTNANRYSLLQNLKH
jgi:hypothetical protein